MTLYEYHYARSSSLIRRIEDTKKQIKHWEHLHQGMCRWYEGRLSIMELDLIESEDLAEIHAPEVSDAA